MMQTLEEVYAFLVQPPRVKPVAQLQQHFLMALHAPPIPEPIVGAFQESLKGLQECNLLDTENGLRILAMRTRGGLLFYVWPCAWNASFPIAWIETTILLSIREITEGEAMKMYHDDSVGAWVDGRFMLRISQRAGKCN